MTTCPNKQWITAWTCPFAKQRFSAAVTPCKSSSKGLNLDVCLLTDFQDELVCPLECKAQGLAEKLPVFCKACSPPVSTLASREAEICFKLGVLTLAVFLFRLLFHSACFYSVPQFLILWFLASFIIREIMSAQKCKRIELSYCIWLL